MIKIRIGEESFNANLKRNKSPKTVQAIIDALPIQGNTNTWGDEIYFTVPVDVELENAVETVHIGDLAYWPQGNAFCIFYGKTPLSNSEYEIIPASAVNLIGRIENAENLKKHKAGEKIKITIIDS